MDNVELHQAVLKRGQRAYSEFVYIYHTYLELNEPYDALDAPFTEVLLYTLKDGADKAKFRETLNALIVHANTWSATHKGGWGQIIEDESIFAVVLGWDNAEVR